MRLPPLPSAVLAAVVACRAAPPPPPRTAPTPPSAPTAPVAAPTTDASTTVTAAEPSLAPHGSPVPIAGTDRRVEFVGDAAQAMVALVRGPAGATPVEAWPVGVRVLAGASRADGQMVALLVETVAALDRPAGLRAVLALQPGNDPTIPWSVQPAPLRWQRAARGLSDAASLAPLFDGDDPAVAVCDALQRAVARPAPHPAWLDPAGVDAFVAWQDGLVTAHAGPLPGPALARAARTLAGATCPPDRMELVGDVRAPRVRSLVVEVPPPRPPAPSQPPPRDPAPARVEASPPSETLRAWLRARYPDAPVVVGSAPLTAAGGRVSVVVVAAFDGNLVALEESGVIRALPIGRAVNINDDRVTAVRFVDADHDGRTDVVLESQGVESVAPGAPQAPPRMHHRGLYFTPQPTFDASIGYDEGSVPELLAAPDLDAAVAALAPIPWEGVTVREACPLVRATATLAGARGVSTPAAQLLRYEEPSTVGWRAERVALASLAADDWWGGAVACRNLRCDGARMVCVGHYDEPGPGGTTYWFTREGGRLRIRALAVYAGS